MRGNWGRNIEQRREWHVRREERNGKGEEKREQRGWNFFARSFLPSFFLPFFFSLFAPSSLARVTIVVPRRVPPHNFHQSIIQDVRNVVRRLQDRPRRTTRFLPSCSRAGNVSDELPVVEGKCARGCCDATYPRSSAFESTRASEPSRAAFDSRTDGRTNEQTANTNAPSLPLSHTSCTFLPFNILIFFPPGICRKYLPILIPQLTAAIFRFVFHAMIFLSTRLKSRVQTRFV